MQSLVARLERQSATLRCGDPSVPVQDAVADVDAPDRVAPDAVELAFEEGVATLPPHSLVVVKVER